MAPLGALSVAGLMEPLITGAVREYGSYHLAIMFAGVLLSPLEATIVLAADVFFF
jgi:hypothetical protein